MLPANERSSASNSGRSFSLSRPPKLQATEYRNSRSSLASVSCSWLSSYLQHSSKLADSSQAQLACACIVLQAYVMEG